MIKIYTYLCDDMPPDAAVLVLLIMIMVIILMLISWCLADSENIHCIRFSSAMIQNICDTTRGNDALEFSQI